MTHAIEELRAVAHWVAWRLENKDGKDTKVPYVADNGRHASSTDPATWMLYDAAAKTYEKAHHAGLGFVVTADDPYCGIDLDHCRDPKTGAIKAWAMEIVEALDSYTEITPSGAGLRVWIKGQKTGTGCKKSIGGDGGKVEIYDQKRFFTVTTNHLAGTPGAINERQEELAALEQTTFGALAPAPQVTASPAPASIVPSISAQQVVALMRKAKNAATIECLMAGDLSEYSNDDSSADAALCCHAAWYTHDPAVIDQVMRMGKLGERDKWVSRADYRKRTIDRAIATVPVGYQAGAEAPGPIGRLASDFNMRRIEWLWQGRLALGMLAGMDGDPSLGKSTLLADMTAHITTGCDWPDGTRCPRGGVIIVAAEDSVEQVWVPRLKAAGADLSKVLIIGVIKGTDGKERLPSLPENLALFEKAIIDMGAKLIGFDPIMPYLSKTANANSDKDVRQCLTPLADMLDRVNCCGLMLRHFAKSDKVANALYRGLGSIAFNGLARTAMAVSKVPTETGSDVPEAMSLMVTKNNVGIKPRSRRYRIEAVDLGGGIVTSRIAWGDASNDRPDDLLTEAGRTVKPGEQAMDFLRTALGDGPRLATEVEALAEAEGIAMITLRRARVKLRIASAPSDFKGPWMWQLPPEC